MLLTISNRVFIKTLFKTKKVKLMKKIILSTLLSFIVILTAHAGPGDLTNPEVGIGSTDYYAIYKTTNLSSGEVTWHFVGLSSTLLECSTALNQALMLPTAQLVKPCRRILRAP